MPKAAHRRSLALNRGGVLTQVTLFEQNFGDFRGRFRRKSWIGNATFAKGCCREDLPT
jgi:hypothetical protein